MGAPVGWRQSRTFALHLSSCLRFFECGNPATFDLVMLGSGGLGARAIADTIRMSRRVMIGVLRSAERARRKRGWQWSKARQIGRRLGSPISPVSPIAHFSSSRQFVISSFRHQDNRCSQSSCPGSEQINKQMAVAQQLDIFKSGSSQHQPLQDQNKPPQFNPLHLVVRYTSRSP